MSYNSYYDNDDVESGEKEQKKPETHGGSASAEGVLRMNAAALGVIQAGSQSGGNEAWITARAAGLLGAKESDERVLVSQSINVTAIEIEHEIDDDNNTLRVRCQVKTMERLGAQTAALVGCGSVLIALMDRLRTMDRDISITSLRMIRE